MTAEDRLREQCATPSETRGAADPETVARAMLAELERQAGTLDGACLYEGNPEPQYIGVDGRVDLIALAKAAIAAVEGRNG